MKEERSFILTIDNLISDQACDGLVNYFNMLEANNLTGTRRRVEGALEINKDDSFIYVPDDGYVMHHLPGGLIEELEIGLYHRLLPEYYSKYSILETCKILKNFNNKIQKTKPGGGYHAWHFEADNMLMSHRVLAWIVYLNDDFEGGETEFLYQGVRVKPKKGTAVIWPAAFTHAHRGNPPLDNTKYIATGWFCFFE